jgi:hypothetical protein
MSLRFGRGLLAISLVLIPTVVAAAPVTLRFSGDILDVWWDDDPEAAWTDLSAIDPGMPWHLTVTYDSDFPGHQHLDDTVPSPLGAVWSYNNAVTAASFVVGPHSYAASEGDIWTNYGLPYGFGPGWPAELGQVQFEFNPGLWTAITAGSPAIWEGNMIVSYNDTGAFYGALPAFLDYAPLQGLQSHLLWERIPAAGGGGQFYSAHGQIAVEQIAAVPEPTTLSLLGAGAALFLARRYSRR